MNLVNARLESAVRRNSDVTLLVAAYLHCGYVMVTLTVLRMVRMKIRLLDALLVCHQINHAQHVTLTNFAV